MIKIFTILIMGILISSTYAVEGNSIKDEILFVIKKGSRGLGFPLGIMPKGVVSGQNAEIIAEYVAKGMKGKQPPAFAACASCHGNDGKGNNGMSPDISSYAENRIKLYAKACNRGLSRGCYSLGILYANAQGVKQDYAKAKELFGKACDGKINKGCEYYSILNKQGY